MVKNRLEYDDLVCERRINSYEELMEIVDSLGLQIKLVEKNEGE